MNLETVKGWPQEKLLGALELVSFHRVLDESALVGLLVKTDKDGTRLTPKEILDDLDYTIDSERKLIVLVGRRAAAKVYGHQAERRSSIRTVDFVLTTDFHTHYEDLIKREAAQFMRDLIVEDIKEGEALASGEKK